MATPAHTPSTGSVNTADIEAMKIVNQHWLNDHNIINTKLSQYLAVQTLLIVGVRQMTDWRSPLVAMGLVSSACWLFSMLRTQEIRRHWERYVGRMLQTHQGLAAFNFLELTDLKWWGKVPTTVTQTAIPGIGFIIWIYALFPR